MTILAGAYSFVDEHGVDEKLCATLAASISRCESDEVLTFMRPRCFVAKVDIGAHRVGAVRTDDDGAVSVLAGEPILGLEEATSDRSDELNALHNAWRNSDWSPLVKTRGSFSAAHYQPGSQSLFLIVDKLGVRPLYLWTDGRMAVFASALRILERLTELGLRMDLRGTTEIIAFGFPLADRTPYAATRRLNAAELVQLSPKGISSDRYWRWDRTEPSPERDEKTITRRLYGCFAKAVDLRRRGDRVTQAFLSGGLDSRCVVTALAEQGAKLHTYNFSWEGSLDQILGAAYAERLGTRHHAETLKLHESGDAWPEYLKRSLETDTAVEGRNPERPRLVWSGDGGSVVAGHVYLTERMIESSRKGAIGEAVDEFLRENPAGVPRRLLKPMLMESLVQMPKLGITEELASLDCVDPGRSLFFFLLLNDQRRHLSEHFEQIDLTRVEYLVPFLDADLVAMFSATPIDYCLRHKLYMKWLQEFPAVITSVPWQAYPGHVQCPLPMPERSWAQWDISNKEKDRVLKEQALRQARQVLKTPPFPSPIIGKARLRAARWLTRLGLANYSYVFRAAAIYQRYWATCSARYELP